ncbi:MAG: alpha/beta hydrolase [Defluviitaleaceae bacterium]|nr:alpha/beta hydrolase [Defluviitaleaceae bacterium]MCL2837390.1 alpha/beta hydrolase [Defluviitaleaceae bacterium]
MANFDFKGKSIYYEEHGSGEPLIVLNGIFMSCMSWMAFVPAFSAEFRLILVDMLDQGRSSMMDAEYTQELQTEVILALYEHLGLEKAHIMGISYGGEVAMKLAAAYPGKVGRMILSNTAAHTSHWLRDIGRSWEYAYQSRDGSQFFKTCVPIVYSPGFYDANHDWMSAREDLFSKFFGAEVYDAFGRLTRSAETHDARPDLDKITAPALVISSEFDFITPPYQQKELVSAMPNASHILIPGAGHALMYEKPNEFTAAVIGFLRMKETLKVL